MADSSESSQVSDADSARSLSPSGNIMPDEASTPPAPGRVPASAPTVIAKSPSGAAAPASRAGASPSGAWPADSRPIGPADSVFTPWSARNLTGSDSPAAPTPAGDDPADDARAGSLAGAAFDATDEATTPAGRPSPASSVTAPRFSKRPADGEAAASASGGKRRSAAHDPLSGPWPSFTRRSAADAQTGLDAAADDANQAESAPAVAPPPDQAAAAATAATAPDDQAAAETAAPAWADEPASPLGAAGATAFAAPPWRATPSASAASLGEDDEFADYAFGAAGPAGDAASFGAASPGGYGGYGGYGGFGGGGAGDPAGPAGPVGPVGPVGPARPAGRRRLGSMVGIAAAVAALVAGGGIYLYVQKSSPAKAADNRPEKNQSPAPKRPEHVVAITPASGTRSVNGAADIRVEFSAPLGATSPMPTLKPAIPGTWHRDGSSAVFVPDRGFKPRTKVTVRVPAGGTGVTSTGGGRLGAPVTATFRTGTYSSVRLEQLLAQLGYLPLTWAPATGSPPSLTDARAQRSAAYEPPAGTYTWQPGYPSALTRLWRPDKPSMVLQGAVMAFQADHGLMSDMIYENQQGLTLHGSIGHRLWRAMFRAIARDNMNKHGYTYALASQHAPETLTVWHNGVKIFRHLANTGIPIRPTAVRTDPVYIRYQSQIMKGHNPDGSKYADPVAWVAYFHGGEAVHYFPRYSYGSQQSLGCVELPWTPAKRIWPYLTFGTLVTVTAP